MRKGKITTQVKIFDCSINAEFEATILDDGSMILEFKDALHIPAGKFVLGATQDKHFKSR